MIEKKYYSSLFLSKKRADVLVVPLSRKSDSLYSMCCSWIVFHLSTSHYNARFSFIRSSQFHINNNEKNRTINKTNVIIYVSLRNAIKNQCSFFLLMENHLWDIYRWIMCNKKELFLCLEKNKIVARESSYLFFFAWFRFTVVVNIRILQT